MKSRINGLTWTIRDADIEDWGECTPSERLIELRVKQSDKERLDSLIHEVLHALDRRLSEQKVQRFADVLSDILWKDKWRRGKKT